MLCINTQIAWLVFIQLFGKDKLMGIMHLPWKFSTHFHALLYFSVITPFLRHILSYKNHSTTLTLWPLHINLCFLDSALDGRIPKREIKLFVTFLVNLHIFFFILWNFHYSFRWPNCKTNFTSLFLLVIRMFSWLQLLFVIGEYFCSVFKCMFFFLKHDWKSFFFNKKNKIHAM